MNRFTCSWLAFDNSKNLLWVLIKVTVFKYTSDRNLKISAPFQSHIMLFERKNNNENNSFRPNKKKGNLKDTTDWKTYYLILSSKNGYLIQHLLYQKIKECLFIFFFSCESLLSIKYVCFKTFSNKIIFWIVKKKDIKIKRKADELLFYPKDSHLSIWVLAKFSSTYNKFIYILKSFWTSLACICCGVFVVHVINLS